MSVTCRHAIYRSHEECGNYIWEIHQDVAQYSQRRQVFVRIWGGGIRIFRIYKQTKILLEKSSFYLLSKPDEQCLIHIKEKRPKSPVMSFLGFSVLTYDEQPAEWRHSHTHVTLVHALMRLCDVIDDHVTSRRSPNNRFIFIKSCWDVELTVL